MNRKEAKERPLPPIEVTLESQMLDFVYYCDFLSRLEESDATSEYRYIDFDEGGVTIDISTSVEEVNEFNRDIRPYASLSVIYKKQNGKRNVRSYVFFRTPQVKFREYEIEKIDDFDPFFPTGFFTEREIKDPKELMDRVMLLKKLHNTYGVSESEQETGGRKRFPRLRNFFKRRN